MSEHSPDGKAKVRGTKEGPSSVSLLKIRGYDKGQHLSWGKVQLKKVTLVSASSFMQGGTVVVSMQGGRVWFHAE